MVGIVAAVLFMGGWLYHGFTTEPPVTRMDMEVSRLHETVLGGDAPCVAKCQALIDSGWVKEPYYAVYGMATTPRGTEGHVWLVVDGKIVDPALSDATHYEPMLSERNPKVIKPSFQTGGATLLHKQVKDATR